jgi:hypothetical protein
MLVSVGSFLPIIIVGPISDLVGTTNVMLVVATLITLSGVASFARRGPLAHGERAMAGMKVDGTAVDSIGVAMRTEADPNLRKPEDDPTRRRPQDPDEPAGD